MLDFAVFNSITMLTRNALVMLTVLITISNTTRELKHML